MREWRNDQVDWSKRRRDVKKCIRVEVGKRTTKPAERVTRSREVKCSAEYPKDSAQGSKSEAGKRCN